jgi:hypothetical protein
MECDDNREASDHDRAPPKPRMNEPITVAATVPRRPHSGPFSAERWHADARWSLTRPDCGLHTIDK